MKWMNAKVKRGKHVRGKEMRPLLPTLRDFIPTFLKNKISKMGLVPVGMDSMDVDL